MDFYGKRVLVMGLGVHGGGLGVARWLLRQGAQVTVTDLASSTALATPLAALQHLEAETGNSMRYVLGEHRAEDFTSADMVVVNPAVRPDSPWLQLTREAGVPLESEMSLFFRQCSGPIIGITGTKGKSTTTLLTAAILRKRFPDTVAAGNLRVSALEALPQIGPQTPVVLELSSFQLSALGRAGLSPQLACITNISADHLNYHGSMAEYVRAKEQIYLHQGRDDTLVLEAELAQRGSDSPFPVPLAPAPGKLVTFSTNSEQRADCYVSPESEVWFRQERLFAAADLVLPGVHNLANTLAAAALARCFGIPAIAIAAAAVAFRGVEHRLEPVANIAGVQYINDTTATNPAAVQAALSSLEAPVVLLAGGSDKQLEFAELGRAIANRVKAVVLLEGSATTRLIAMIEATGRAPLMRGPYASLEAALDEARQLAVAGDIVLLSPGCASFGMFRNEFHRGEEFRRIVRNMAATQ
jgi:UDP-N-acetylmuramoylalanine--D-glutamate ligase